ncbi:glutamine amidotransferase [Aporhodopirellula aestuarii]|uniref:Glutamine amidotransferase n=1 Tax=Aporhodopirellula aestuarii TaxID=2950107 RepID=A0ABT0U754_9BACT|nr:glutamine amidotransferase [Aporhodopirellula aestuarii]MCM2372764.1 glutamine amidotransferase [Aporhodopirellula aestuarii]
MHWQPLYWTATYWILVAAIIALLIAARRIAISEKTAKWWLLALRGGVLLGLVVLLINPIDRRETILPPRPPAVSLLVDCSQSMTLGVERSRMDDVKQTIDKVTRKVQSTHPMKFSMYRFGRHLAKVPNLTALNANDDASLLGDALERLPSRLAGDQPRAVVLFSDGAVPTEPQLQTLSSAYRDLNVPIHVVLPQQQEILGDIAITQLAIPPRVASGDEATVRAVIDSRGFDGQRVVVSIRPADRPNAAALTTLPIMLHDGPTPCELVVTADSSMSQLELQIPVLQGEAVGSNNRIPFRLIDRDPRLKVLYMEGNPGKAYEALQDAVQEDPDIECVSIVVDNVHASRPRLKQVDHPSRGYPATRTELFGFDVVICSDIPRRAFTQEQIDWTVEWVGKRGGGFAMVGGIQSFGSGRWDRTEWEQLIPFDMAGHRDHLAQRFEVEVPVDAESHPIWRLFDDPKQNHAAIQAMPQFTGTNLISRVKPAATLLGHTRNPLLRVGIMPVFACQTYGRGRTFAMSTDTTEAWGQYFESQWGVGDNRYYRKFWRNVARWLAENSQASQRRLLVRCDRVIYSQNDPIQVVVEAFDKQLNPTTDYRLTVRLQADELTSSDPPALSTIPSDVIDLQPDVSLQRYSGSIQAELPSSDKSSSPMQTIHLVVTAWLADKQVASESIELQLLHQSEEWLKPQSQPETLQLVAESSGGSILTSDDDLMRLLRSYDSAPGERLIHTVPLWDRPWIWVGLLSGLVVDWVLRRRHAATDHKVILNH